jgi:quercetin dioxygenase-like cupin family protein
MRDTTITKIDSAHSPRGRLGQKYLASGVRTSMRLWEEEPTNPGPEVARAYEVIGFVLEGRAELHIEGQMVLLSPGDSYVVPRGARHCYRVLEHFRTVEATSPPAHVHGRDEMDADWRAREKRI